MQRETNPYARLKEARIQAELSQEALAEVLGVHQTTVSNIELEKKTPGAQTRLKIQAFAGIPFEAWP